MTKESPANPSLDPPSPLERQPKESAKAYAAFTVYMEMGDQRSLERVGKKLKKSWKLMGRWSARWNWTARIRAFQAWQERIKRDAEEQAMKGKAGEWARRQQTLREEDWNLGEQLRAKVRAMLEYPIAQKITTQDGKKVIINPTRWTLSCIATMLKTASDLQRLSAGMPTEKTEITGPDNAPISTGQVVILELPPGRSRLKTDEPA